MLLSRKGRFVREAKLLNVGVTYSIIAGDDKSGRGSSDVVQIEVIRQSIALILCPSSHPCVDKRLSVGSRRVLGRVNKAGVQRDQDINLGNTYHYLDRLLKRYLGKPLNRRPPSASIPQPLHEREPIW